MALVESICVGNDYCKLTAIYLVYSVAEFMSHDGTSSKCLIGTTSNGNKWKTKFLIPFVITVCSVPLMHCFVGPAVLRWRSFYETQDDAWKAHYQENMQLPQIGHSLGGAIAALLGLKVGALQRLRTAAIVALAQDSKADKALIFRLARQFIFVSMNQSRRIEVVVRSALHSAASTVELDHKDYVGSKRVDHSYSLWNELDRTNNGGDIADDNFENPFNDKAAVMNSLDDPVSQFLETVPRSENGSAGNEAEMFLPGLVIHMIPQQRHISTPLWKGWSVQESVQNYDAYLANIEIFKDIVVSPNMFFDHLPWR
ncbi:hypothetical protein OIU84_012158 [Salix udensis]|uniref:DUF7358 domain-containing protein n=1 Tax=Salix udensis TaxID=889485 RepID=A0AAD6NSG1_9ROSI|nr:hypothetical protein OIU84_012158 [Salix udensis]